MLSEKEVSKIGLNELFLLQKAREHKNRVDIAIQEAKIEILDEILEIND